MNSHNPLFLEQIKNSPLAQFQDFFTQTVRPAIDITSSTQPINPGCSKFGGAPDLPPGTLWPEHPKAYYRFIAQINFAEINVSGTDLPTKGLLSLFYAEDEGEGEVFWRDEDYILAIYTSSTEELTPLLPSEAKRISRHARRIQFTPCMDIPYDEYQTPQWPSFSHEQEDAYHTQLRDLLHSQNYLLGYPSHYSLGYDPTPGENYVALLTLDSDEKLVWEWHDGDKLMLFIDKDALKKGDFSALVADAG
ncbi:hypothetical protein SB6411_03385 [Klebsiella spallanzanii]|uniref:DUF1963 domain-containing protein n=1 Tax=Klebsiella spallanzanii TaxID=2587528 RepID=A0ABY6VQ57_9ENTR|nr:YwqG family protein [Klebsiella spallanzanii]VUS88521.1 hypothetical protein SB6411_03385 [Klebsiella spallanzanii]